MPEPPPPVTPTTRRWVSDDTVPRHDPVPAWPAPPMPWPVPAPVVERLPAPPDGWYEPYVPEPDAADESPPKPRSIAW